MKNVILIFASLTISIFSFAQTTSDDQNHIKITAANDSLNVRFKDQLFRLRNIQDLDSCLKKNLPGMKLPVVEFETYTDLTAINHRAIIIIMDKYRLPVVSEQTISSGNGKVASFVKGLCMTTKVLSPLFHAPKVAEMRPFFVLLFLTF